MINIFYVTLISKQVFTCVKYYCLEILAEEM